MNNFPSLTESIGQAHQESSGKIDQERYKWVKVQEKLEAELQDLRNKLTQERSHKCCVMCHFSIK